MTIAIGNDHAGTVYKFEIIKYLEEKVRTHPNSEAISIVQRRVKEKEFIKSLELPIGLYEPIESAESLLGLEDKKIFPAILKQSKFGYDGKGQYHVNSLTETKAVLNNSNEDEFVLEKKLNLDKEISVILSTHKSNLLLSRKIIFSEFLYLS